MPHAAMEQFGNCNLFKHVADWPRISQKTITHFADTVSVSNSIVSDDYDQPIIVIRNNRI